MKVSYQLKSKWKLWFGAPWICIESKRVSGGSRVASLLDGILEHRAGGFQLLLEEAVSPFCFHGISLIDSSKLGQDLSPEVPEELVSLPCCSSLCWLFSASAWQSLAPYHGSKSLLCLLPCILFCFNFSASPLFQLCQQTISGPILFSLLGVAVHKTG